MRLLLWQVVVVFGISTSTVLAMYRGHPAYTATIVAFVVGGACTIIAHVWGSSDAFLALLVPTAASGALLLTEGMTISAMRWGTTTLCSVIPIYMMAWRIIPSFRFNRTFAFLFGEDLVILSILMLDARMTSER